MRSRILLALPALLLRAAAGQAPPEVAEILKKVSETYKGVSEYELVAEVMEKLPGNSPPSHVRVLVAFRAPNQYRLEGTIPGLMEDNPNLDESVMIYDGSALWFYLPRSNQYASIPADKLAADDEGSAHTPQATDQVALEKYRAAADFIDGAKFLREDEIETSGAKLSCYVVSVPEKWPGPYTWWVDKETHRIVREDKSDGSTAYTTIRLGERLPDTLFKFEPPPGARRLEPALSGRSHLVT
jgi:outer membrane lipoprotein-sorting protein